MRSDLLNLIPNDILNLIWKQLAPDFKYLLNKYYLNKYYNYRFYSIHVTNFNNFNNYGYYYYLLTNDLLYFSKVVLSLYITNSNNTNCYKKFIYKNVVFSNLVDFFYYYCTKKSHIIDIIKKYNLSHLIKKTHKNNANKNIRWTL